jgi:hypothetical protein
MKRDVIHVSETYSQTSTDDYQLIIAHLVVKVIQLHQGWNGRVLP